MAIEEYGRPGRPGEQGAYDGLSVQLLGPVTLRMRGTAIPMRGQRQRRFLASLALKPGQVISKQTIINDSWDGEPPSTVAGQLQTSAWMIRTALAAEGLPPAALASHTLGYELRLPSSHIDLFVFRDLVRAARTRYAGGEHVPAAEHLDAALAMWNGPALADITSLRLRMKGEALDQERTAAAELRAQVDIAGGHYREAIERLSELIDCDPLREDLYTNLMTAYYNEGRQADAIHVFHRAKATLREQIGINPGARLRQTLQAVLRQDPHLLRSSGPTLAG
jgi:SARP family transcriptional regulator, regulator of embCAB operon